jgi:hypothetical protein
MTASLRTSPEADGEQDMPRIRCPQCGARYNVGDSASGKRTTCKGCGQRFRIPEFPKPASGFADDTLTLAPLDDSFAALEHGEKVDAKPPPPPVVSAAEAEASAISLAADSAAAYAPAEAGDEPLPAGTYGAYFRDLRHSLAFPTRVGDLVTFLILWAIVGTALCLLPAMGCLGFLVGLIVIGWYVAYQLNVAAGAAGGEEDLPDMALTGGWLDDIIYPFLKMLATYLVVYVPLLAYLIATGLIAKFTTAAPGMDFFALLQSTLGAKEEAIAIGMVLLGYFFWPILVLVVACGSVPAMFRIDLIATTIVRTLPAYAMCVALVYAAWFAPLVLDALRATEPDPLARPSMTDAFAGRLVDAALFGIDLYLMIFAMRAIGLYYHHFKSRFAWSWG